MFVSYKNFYKKILKQLTFSLPELELFKRFYNY
nr:MAG TPA: hypothetical protein [Caudoviricetes sp.]